MKPSYWIILAVLVSFIASAAPVPDIPPRLDVAAPLSTPTAAELFQQGVAQFHAGELQSAIQTYETAIKAVNGVNALALRQKAEILAAMGVALHRNGQLERARRSHEEAGAIWDRLLGNRHPAYALSLNNVGEILRDQGHLREARGLFTRALEIADTASPSDENALILILNNFGVLNNQAGRFSEAERLFRRSLDLAQRIETRPEVTARTAHNLAFSLLRTHRVEEATEMYLFALGLWQKSKTPQARGYAATLINLGTLASARRDYAAAERHYLTAEQSLRGGPSYDMGILAQLRHCFANLYTRTHHWEQAETNYREGLRLMEQVFGADHPNTALLLTDLAVLQRSRGQKKEAAALAARAQQIIRHHRQDNQLEGVVDIGELAR